MPKQWWLAAAWSWTLLVLSLCLISFSKLPNVKVSNADKYVHLSFHFVFTLLWFKALYPESAEKFWKKLFTVMLMSVAFGVLIEIAQGFFTKTRHADVMDVVANFSGCLIAVIILLGMRFLGRI